jgi:peroxiredoxin
MSALVSSLSTYEKDFKKIDVRILCITKEPPITARHWKSERGVKHEVYSDIYLEFTNSIVGSFDLSAYLLTQLNIHLGSVFMVPTPSVAVVDGNGKIIKKFVYSSPGNYMITVSLILC